MVRWSLTWSIALGLAGACGAPCVDDGLHARQSGAACMAQTSTGTTTSTTSTSTSTSTQPDVTSGTTTGDVQTGETTVATTGAPDTTSTSAATTSAATSEGSSDGGLQERCDDDVQDPGETGVSCGGVCVALGPEYKCDISEGCEVDDDCMNGHCHATGTCVEALCDNGVYDLGLEAHVDCGLSCPGCGLGLPCSPGPNACFVGACINGTCALDPSCADGEGPTADETDVDCGGPLCGPSCKHDQLCDGPADCIAGSCVDGVCAEAHCLNDVQDLGETDIDCGGPCARCQAGDACVVPNDCEFLPCAGQVCGG